MAKNESTAINDLIQISQGKIIEVAGGDDNLFVTAQRLPGMPPPMPRKRAPAATPAPAIQEAIAQMPPVDYADDTTDATEIDGPQKKWLDSIETIPFDPSMRVSDASIDLRVGAGTPPHAMAPVRVDAVLRDSTRPVRRQPQGTPRPQPRPPQRSAQQPAVRAQPQRPAARHPLDNVPTRLNHVDVAGGHVSYTPDPDQVAYGNDTDVAPLSAIPTPPPRVPLPLHAPYGAPALPPHAPTAMALPPQALMPTQMPTQVAQALPALVRPYQDGVTPYPVPPWATGQHVLPSAPLASGSAPFGTIAPPRDHLDIYADTENLPRARRSSTPSLRPPISRYLLPVMGGIALLVFVSGYFLVRGDASASAPAAPVASAAAVPVATPPVVSEIVEEPAPQLPPPSWKNREAQPTIVAKAEPVVEPIVEPAEIEMAPVVAKKKASSSSRRNVRERRVAIIELPEAPKRSKLAKPAPVKPAAKPAKADKAIAKSAKADRDPILEEIEKPSKPAVKATGPGKLMISSSVPTLIYIDGRSTNLMTPKTLNLSAGTHKITLLELKSRKAKTVDVDIASGTVSKIDKKF
ncbi:MAG: hypothetical protein ACKV2T_26360 [Kofleriaceae bacterium]